MVLGHLDQINQFTIGEVPMMLDILIEKAKKDLKRIKKKEQALNTQNESLICQIKES